MSKRNTFLTQVILSALSLLLTNEAQAQHNEDIPQQKSSASFDLEGEVQEIKEQHFNVEINISTDTLISNDTTYTLSSYTTLNFDSTGRLTRHTVGTYNNRGKEKSSYSTMYRYNTNAQISTVEYYENEDIQYTKNLSYNNDNQLAELKKLDKKGKLETTALFYYRDGQVFNIKIKDEDNVMQNFIRLSYDNKGNLKEREYRGETMQLLNFQKYIRDTLSDDITRLNLYDYAADGKLRELLSYQYDENGNTIQQTITDSNKRTTLYQTNTYNSRNELIEEVSFSNEIKTENTYQYIYDKHNNWTTKTISHSGQLVGLKKRTIVYYTKKEE